MLRSVDGLVAADRSHGAVPQPHEQLLLARRIVVDDDDSLVVRTAAAHSWILVVLLGFHLDLDSDAATGNSAEVRSSSRHIVRAFSSTSTPANRESLGCCCVLEQCSVISNRHSR